MERQDRGISLPHLSWSGPGPASEVEAYALAITVRIVGSGYRSSSERGPDIAPSSLTTANMREISRMYAFCRERIRRENISSLAGLLKMMAAADVDAIIRWMNTHKAAIREAEAELIEYVDTKATPGFHCYG